MKKILLLFLAISLLSLTLSAQPIANTSKNVATAVPITSPEDYQVYDNDFDFRITGVSTVYTVAFTNISVPNSGTDRGAVDMNGDFLDDLVSITDQADYISINYQQSNGTFVRVDHSISANYSAEFSMAGGDVDGNGYNDLVFGNSTGVNILVANANGTGYSVLAEAADVLTQRTNMVDINGDGDLDVFVLHDIAPNVYFINEGNGNLTFYQGADPNGVPEGLGIYPSGGDYGSVWVDYDNDGDIDMFNAKCGGSVARKTNQLFRNNGNSSFTEVGAAAGMADPIQTWSAAWGDYDGDGYMDSFVGSSVASEAHKLMHNNGNGTFTDITSSSGLNLFSGKGKENSPYDFNNDGFIDIYSNGNILLNNGDGTFTVQSTGIPQEGSVGDLNNDGFLDISYGDTAYLNDGNSNNWIEINLTGVQSNKNGIGARVEVSSPSFNNSAARKAQIRDIRSGEGYAYMSSLNAYFGLGTDTSVYSVTVKWPSGNVDVITNPNINEALHITEGQTLSLQSTMTNDLILYPNPTKGLLNLNSSFGFENAVYSVFDLTGKRVLNSGFNSNTINVSELSAGMYILKITDGQLIKSQKFIKQ